MRTPDDAAHQSRLGAQLTWVQPKWYRRTYELRGEDAPLGSLQWESAWRSAALAEVGSERWRFRRGGVFRPSTAVIDAGSGAQAGIFEGGWNGAGILTLAAGRVYTWRKANWWGTRWEWTDAAGTRVALFRRASGAGRREIVELSSGAPLSAEMGLLAALGWYLIVLAQAAASAAAAT
jgi:hypothetical protein